LFFFLKIFPSFSAPHTCRPAVMMTSKTKLAKRVAGWGKALALISTVLRYLEVQR